VADARLLTTATCDRALWTCEMQEFRGPSKHPPLTQRCSCLARSPPLTESSDWSKNRSARHKLLPAAHTAQQRQQQDKEGRDEPNPQSANDIAGLTSTSASTGIADSHWMPCAHCQRPLHPIWCAH